jgi:hypothetical protein
MVEYMMVKVRINRHGGMHDVNVHDDGNGPEP